MITTIRDTDYVLNKVEGKVTIRELLEYAERNVDKWVADPVLWDLSNASMSEEKSDYNAIRGVVANIHNLAEKRKGRKTTFVTKEPYAYGMLRMALAIVDCIESRMVATVYSDFEEAKEWLMSQTEE